MTVKPAKVVLMMAQTRGGIGRHLASLVPEVQARGGVVEVVGPEATRDLIPGSWKSRFHRLEVPTLRGELGHPLLLWHLRRVLAPAELVHAHGIRAATAAALALTGASGTAFVATIHNALLSERRFDRLLAVGASRLLARKADRRIYVSSDLAESARRGVPRYAGSVLEIPAAAEVSPVAPREVEAARRSLDLPEGVSLVVSAGRLHRQKGFDVLVEAAGQIRDLPVQFVLAGEGPEHDALRQEIAARGLEDTIRLLGHRQDSRALLAAADVVCMPSRWEGSPLALHEAMAAGRPVVAAATGGIVDRIVDGVTGLLVPPEDSQALAAALRRLLEDGSLSADLGKRAAREAAGWPDAAAVARRIGDLYEEILQRPLGSSKDEKVT